MIHQRSTSAPLPVLTIAGSDSGGAAGLQADLKTYAAIGVYGMSVITVATAQNSVSVEAVLPLPMELVASQLETVLSDYGAKAVKTGYIGRPDLIEIVAAKLREYSLTNVVIDPVLVNHKGQAMFSPEVHEAYATYLLPLADLVTPNCHEAALLANSVMPEEMSLGWLKMMAEELHALGPDYVLIKGDRIGNEWVDNFFDGVEHLPIATPWIDTRNTHGSGDTLSAAACAYLAQGFEPRAAVMRAHQFTSRAIRGAVNWRLGQGHGPVNHRFS